MLDNASNRDWWKGAVIYQIYPRSFQDTNGDGIGDLNGIVGRIPYVASLGVDAIWISPFFRSPMKDFGYDVSDYCDVDPMFGSLADFDALVDTAHRFHLRVLIDLVLSHTSAEHPWFEEGASGRDNGKASWYVWSDAKPDGTAPNNWLSIFGGPAWQWEPRREQYYLHNFLVSQPDLNFHNPVVQEALLDVVRFWLNRGVDGFRLDTVNFYTHDAQLRDNPPLAPDDRNAVVAPRVNPYNHQDHVFDKNRPENLDFLKKLRTVIEPFAAATIGEIGDAQYGLELMSEYTSGGDKLNMCYTFDFLSGAQPTAETFAGVMQRFDQVGDGWACWAFSNHDVMRHTSRWQLSDAAQRMFTTLIMCLRGSVCLYQGEELGLTEAEIGYDDLQDPYGIEFWPEFKGRDGCRTPMVWDAEHHHAGFSNAPRTWLPIPQEHLNRSVGAQDHDPGAMLHHYRRAIAFRRSHAALTRGDQSPLTAVNDVVWFTRSAGDETLLCAFNISDTPSDFVPPKGDWHLIAAELGSAHTSADGKYHMGPWQVCIARLSGPSPQSRTT